MRKEVREDILKVLDESIQILLPTKNVDINHLKELSNHTIHDIFLYQDEDAISIALLIYSMYKILSRDPENHLMHDQVLAALKNASRALKQDFEKDYKKAIAQAFTLILSVDTKLRLYYQEILDKAKITKGSKLYEHGISVAQVASLLGVSQWDLMNYIGKTQIVDCQECKSDVKSRLKFAKRIFS